MGSVKKSKITSIATTAIISILLLTTCKDLFNAGLGEKVDIDPPVVAILSHANGQYVGGTVTIGGTLSDDSEVAALQISFNGGSSFSAVNFNPKSTQWEYSLNTTQFSDGEIEILLRIEDGSGKSALKKLLVGYPLSSSCATLRPWSLLKQIGLN